MDMAFAVSSMLDVPEPGCHASVLTAIVDLDVATEETALRQIMHAVPGAEHAVVVDVCDVFVSACGARLVVALVERAVHARKPCAVVGAPPWMHGLALHLDVPPIPFHPTMASAVGALCAQRGPVRGAAGRAVLTSDAVPDRRRR